jgi:FkbM family methyltransferase
MEIMYQNCNITPLCVDGTDRGFITAIRRLREITEEEVYAHILSRFTLLEEVNRKETERFLKINKFWGSFDIAEEDYGVFKNRAAALKTHAEDLLWLYERLDDHRSRFVLGAVMWNWLDFNYTELYAARENVFPPYFDPDIMKCGEEEVLADLGAFNGDTVLDYIATYGRRYKKIYCYEITPEIFKELEKNLIQDLGLKNLELRQKGAGDHNGIMYIKENPSTPTGNSLTDCGGAAAEVAAIDDDITEPVTFIKMDIEGSEQAAVRGCRKHIQNDKPKLAISLYHNNEDIWKIPRMIDEICPGYAFYLRYYGGNLVPSELTLLAVYKNIPNPPRQ